jgi:CRISPR-associated endonuclease/helicase Cas3
LVPYKEGNDIIAALKGDISPEEKRMLLQKSGRYSVYLYEYQIKRLTECKALNYLTNDLMAVKEGFYDAETGVGINE